MQALAMPAAKRFPSFGPKGARARRLQRISPVSGKRYERTGREQVPDLNLGGNTDGSIRPKRKRALGAFLFAATDAQDRRSDHEKF